MSIELYSVLFYVIVTNSLIELWILLGYIEPKKHLVSSTIDLVIIGSVGVVTPLLVIILMAYHEFNKIDIITENWMMVIAGYAVFSCFGWLFIIYKKLNSSKNKSKLVMPK